MLAGVARLVGLCVVGGGGGVCGDNGWDKKPGGG